MTDLLTDLKRVTVNLVGPITPASDNGKRYILTVINYATRYPEAVALFEDRHYHCGRGFAGDIQSCGTV